MPQSKPTPEIPEGVKSCSVLYKAGFKEGRESMLAELRAGGVEPYATLHHDDGYFTTKQREHDLRYSGPMRTEVVTLDQLNTALAAARVQENAEVSGLSTRPPC